MFPAIATLGLGGPWPVVGGPPTELGGPAIELGGPPIETGVVGRVWTVVTWLVTEGAWLVLVVVGAWAVVPPSANLPWNLHVVVPVALGGAGAFPTADAIPAPTTATRPAASAIAATAEIILRDIQISPPSEHATTTARRARLDCVSGRSSHVTQTVRKGRTDPSPRVDLSFTSRGTLFDPTRHEDNTHNCHVQATAAAPGPNRAGSHHDASGRLVPSRSIEPKTRRPLA
jgi:hypothetical protein